MSILIKGMEMPQNCEECDVKAVCKNYWKFIREQHTRPSWCPLVPVPPHGRLIDADALMNEFDGDCYGCPYYGCMARERTAAAPTIIPAEEVYGQYTDTAGNFHWCGTHSGEHTTKAEEGE